MHTCAHVHTSTHTHTVIYIFLNVKTYKFMCYHLQIDIDLIPPKNANVLYGWSLLDFIIEEGARIPSNMVRIPRTLHIPNLALTVPYFLSREGQKAKRLREERNRSRSQQMGEMVFGPGFLICNSKDRGGSYRDALKGGPKVV